MNSCIAPVGTNRSSIQSILNPPSFALNRRRRPNPSHPEAVQPVRMNVMSRSAGHRSAAESCSDERQAPGPATREQIILDHLALVRTIASSIRANLPANVVELDDLIQAGTMGLIDATNKYDFTKQVEFGTYAKHRIRGAILDSLRQLDWASRDMRRRHKQSETATSALTARLNRSPTEAEVAESLGIKLQIWRRTMVDLSHAGPVSVTSPNDKENHRAMDFPCDSETHPDSICARKQMRGALDQVVKLLPERYQTVVSLYYEKEMNMKEIGKFLGVNESRVSQIHKTALERMGDLLQANGIKSHLAFVA